MEINSQWKIESDELNVILMRKRTRKAESKKDAYEYFYYSTIAGALQAILDKEVKSTNLKDIKTVSNRIEEINRDIKKALGKLSKVPAESSQPVKGGI